MRFTTMLVAALIGWVALVPAMAGEARMPKTLEQSLLEEAPEELARAAREDGDPRLGALAFYHPSWHVPSATRPATSNRRWGRI
jgi:hypothetical protein